jgi:hypothetical protein
MRFDQKIMNYVCGDITRVKVINCRKAIEKQAESFGGSFTVYQVITLKAMLKTLRSRIVKEHAELLELFDSLFNDIMSFSVAK